MTYFNFHWHRCTECGFSQKCGLRNCGNKMGNPEPDVRCTRCGAASLTGEQEARRS